MQTLMTRQRKATDETAMVALGAELGASLKGGEVVFLEGNLGMGKTTLARGLVQSFGHRGAVKSPTYTLVEPYEFEHLTVYHFDLYRLGDAEELEYMGVRDYFGDDSIALVEWSERGAGLLPPADLVIRITLAEIGRSLRFEACSERGVECIRLMPDEPDVE